MKLPRLWRKKRGGRLVGSFHATINGDDVNLGTSNADEAHARLLAAVKKKKRNFPNELDEAAAAVDGAPETPPAAPPPAASSPPAPPLVPDAVIPPPAPPLQLPPASSSADARAEAEATNAAAADVGAGGAAANDNAAGAESPISDEVLDQMLANGALVIVDLQLQLQAYAIKRSLKVVAGPVAPDDKFRALASQAWAAQLKIWFPSVAQLPPWGAALLLPLACVPAQLAGATPIPKEEQENQAAPPAQEAA